MGAQNRKNPLQQAFKKGLRKSTGNSAPKGSLFCCPNLPKPWKGHQKSRFSGFGQSLKKDLQRPPFLEAVWSPKSSKSLSGRVPKKHPKTGAPQVSSRLQKGSPARFFFLMLGGSVWRPASRRASGPLRGWIWDGFGTFLDVFLLLLLRIFTIDVPVCLCILLAPALAIAPTFVPARCTSGAASFMGSGGVTPHGVFDNVI